jgi:hypothetical protein
MFVSLKMNSLSIGWLLIARQMYEGNSAEKKNKGKWENSCGKN